MNLKKKSDLLIDFESTPNFFFFPGSFTRVHDIYMLLLLFLHCNYNQLLIIHYLLYNKNVVNYNEIQYNSEDMRFKATLSHQLLET